MLPEIVVLSALGASSFTPAQRRRLETAGRVRYIRAPRRLTRGAFLRAIASAEIAALTPRATPPLERSLLAAIPALRGIAVPTTGTEWIDHELLRAHGIRLAHVPGFSSASAAEFAFGLLVALVRKIPLADRIARGKAPASSLRGVELSGKTLGIVGNGAIGRRVGRIARAAGMRVLANDADPRRGKTSLAALLAASDVVTLHAPLTAKTSSLLDRAAFARMKRGAFLVNTARPALVDRAAVLAALRTKQLAGYAVDLGYEGARGAAGLVGRADVLAVPHVSWYTTEAVARELDGWVDRIVALARTKHAR